MSDTWLSIIEYARRYNVSDMTVRRRIKTGRLNAELRDGKYFIPAQASSVPQPFPGPELAISPSPHSEPVASSQTRTPYSHETVDKQNDKLLARQPTANTDNLYAEDTSHTYPPAQPSLQKAQAVATYANSSASNPGLLAELCETMLEKISQREDLLKAAFQTERDLFSEKIKFFEMELKNRETEIQFLKKEIEDLEVLVKILESTKH